VSKSLVCNIELNKQRGITLTVVDEAAQRTQTFHLDGERITTQILEQDKVRSSIVQASDSIVSKVAGDADESTATQTPTSYLIVCKTFEVTAETVTLKSSGATAIRSEDTLRLSSQAALELETRDAMNLHAATKLQLESDGPVDLRAQSELTARAATVFITGDGKTTIKGSANLELLGAQVELTGDAQASVRAPITKVGKNITTIEGQMVEVKGSLVKLG
jgi:hypothetical protein